MRSLSGYIFSISMILMLIGTSVVVALYFTAPKPADALLPCPNDGFRRKGSVSCNACADVRKSWNEATQTCECRAGQTMVDGTCKCTDIEKEWNATTKRCEVPPLTCPSGQFLVGAECVCSDNQKKVNVSTGLCEIPKAVKTCPSDQTLEGEECRCTNTRMSWNSTTQKCELKSLPARYSEMAITFPYVVLIIMGIASVFCFVHMWRKRRYIRMTVVPGMPTDMDDVIDHALVQFKADIAGAKTNADIHELLKVAAEHDTSVTDDPKDLWSPLVAPRLWDILADELKTGEMFLSPIRVKSKKAIDTNDFKERVNDMLEKLFLVERLPSEIRNDEKLLSAKVLALLTGDIERLKTAVGENKDSIKSRPFTESIHAIIAPKFSILFNKRTSLFPAVRDAMTAIIEEKVQILHERDSQDAHSRILSFVERWKRTFGSNQDILKRMQNAGDTVRFKAANAKRASDVADNARV